MIPAISPSMLRQRLEAGTAVMIDIREPDEFARERIAGARPVPLSAFEQHSIDREDGKAFVFVCRTGNRTTSHAARFVQKDLGEIYQLAGGIDAWKKAGLPTHVDRGAPIDLMRQVQISAGTLVVIGVLLGAFVSPWGYLLSGFVGAGLVTAGITGYCAMAHVLAVLPWNRRATAPAA